MADNKWHLVSTFDRTQTLEEFCNSIDFTIDSDEKYIYRIRDGIEDNEQVKKKNWYRITINDDDSNNVGKVATYDSGSWQEDSNIEDEINLRNNTAYWMYGAKENSTNVWGVTGKDSGEMKWDKILLNIQRLDYTPNHDFHLTIYGGTRGFRSFNGTFTTNDNWSWSHDFAFINPNTNTAKISTVDLNDNSFRDEFEYAKKEGKVKVIFPQIGLFMTGLSDYKQIESHEDENADDFFTRVFKQIFLHKYYTLSNDRIGSTAQLSQRLACSKGFPFTIIYNQFGNYISADGYNINIW